MKDAQVGISCFTLAATRMDLEQGLESKESMIDSFVTPSGWRGSFTAEQYDSCPVSGTSKVTGETIKQRLRACWYFLRLYAHAGVL